jgi:integrase/recombinase XerD
MARPKKLPKVLTSDEQKALLRQCNKRYKAPHRNLCMMRLMLEAGLRAGEVVSLRPEHLNMTTCKLMVREGKGAKDRTLWINYDLRDSIGRWLERRPSSKWLFPTRNGSKLDTRYLRAMVKKYAEKAGIPEWEQISPHTLRHTFATDLYRETKNIRLVQKALGHSDLSTTMIYTHIVDEELEDALRNFRRPAVVT